MTRTVVVTGLGATTPLGGDVATPWDSLLTARSGTHLLSDPKFAELPVRIAGTAKVDPESILEPHEVRRMDRSQQLALIAAREAWADAGAPEIEQGRLGVVVGSGVGGAISLMEQYDILRERGASRVSPMTVPMLMPNGPAAVIGLELGAMAGVHTPVSACASGAEAIGYGAEMIRSGRADVVVCGGTEGCIHPLTISAFAAMRALSTLHDNAAGASRPFDRDRDGFVMGEGAGILVLEEYEHAKKRGAPLYGELLGYGLSGDAYHITAPAEDGDGAFRSMRNAIKRAKIPPEAIGYVNAHGTSTPMGDSIELRAVERLFGQAVKGLSMSSTKSATGHLLGGAGGVEAIFSLLALRDHCLPPTLNLDQPEETLIDLVPHKAREKKIDFVLSNSFGFGGTNASLIFKRV